MAKLDVAAISGVMYSKLMFTLFKEKKIKKIFSIIFGDSVTDFGFNNY